MIKGSNHNKCTFFGDLYHSDVYMPEFLKIKALKMFNVFKNETFFSRHLIESINCDKCHEYNVDKIYESIKNVDEEKINIFEIGTVTSLQEEVVNDTILKFAVRIPYDNEYDVIVIYSDTGKVKTAWINRKDDNHKTLDRRKYVQRPRKK